MDRISTLSASGMASATELTVASLSNPTELNAIGLAVPDWRVCKTVSAGTDNAAWYRLDASSAAVDAPYIMASATAGLRWVAIAGFSQGQPLNIKAPSISTAVSVLANTNNFSEVNVQNLNSGGSASSDFVVTADNGSASTHYVDLGINGSTGGAAPFITANGAYLYTTDNQLDISAQGASGLINLSAGPTPTIALIIAATVVTVPLPAASTSTTTGALVVTGGVGIGGRLNVGGNITAQSGTPFVIAERNVGAGNCGFRLTDATSTFKNWQIAAQFNVSDGVEITPSTTNGGSTYSAPCLTLNTTFVAVPISTASTSTTTGALVVTGGVGIGGRLNVGGAAALSTTLSVGGVSPSTASVISLDSGATPAKAQFSCRANNAGSFACLVYDKDNVNVMFDIDYSAGFIARATTGFNLTKNSGGLNLQSCTGQTIGSVVSGFLSILTLNTTGDMALTSTTASTSTTTGALVVTGGIGCGGRITVDGATTKTLKYVNGVANAAVAVLFGAIGPTGSTAGNAQGWIRIDVAGTDRYIPYW